MLQNAYLVAKFRFDTAENEPIEKSDVSWLIDGRRPAPSEPRARPLHHAVVPAVKDE